MIFLYYSLLIVCIYICLGLGLTILCCPKTLRRYILFIAPIIGYSYLTLAGWYCYNLKLAGTDVYAIPIVGFSSILLLFILLINRNKLFLAVKSLFSNRDILTACSIAILGFFIISLPIILGKDGLTSITIGNADPPNYAIISRFLKEFPRSGGIGFFLQQDAGLKFHIEDSVFGAFISTSFSASLLSLEIYQIQSMTIHIFFAFSIALIYILARHIFQYSYLGASGVTILYALNPIIYYTIYNGFQSQIIAISLSICLLILNIDAINHSQKLSDYYQYLPFSVFLNWAISLTYPHMLPLLYSPIVIYLAWYSKKYSWRLLIYNFLFLLLSLLIMAVLSLHRFKVLVNYFFLMGGSQSGWLTPFIAPSEVFMGFKSKTNFYEILLTVILSIFVIFLIYLGLRQARKLDEKIFILACSLSFPVYLGYIILSLDYLTPNYPSGYKAYKLLSFFLPQLLVSWLLILQNISSFQTKETKLYIILFTIVALSTYNMTASVTKNHGSVTQALIDLQKVERNPAIKSINIFGLDNWWQITWQSYFIGRKYLYFHAPAYYPNPPNSNLNGEWDLFNSNESKVPKILKVKEFKTDSSASIAINSKYILEKADASFWALLEKGWQGFDGTVLWSGGDSNSSAILINCPNNNFPINLKISYSPLKPNNRLSIHLNQKKVVDCLNNQVCEIKNLVLTKGKNHLQFISELPPSLSGKGAPRRLSYAFSSIEIAPSNPNTSK